MTLTTLIPPVAFAAVLLAGWLATKNAPTTVPLDPHQTSSLDRDHGWDWRTHLSNALNPNQPPDIPLRPLRKLYKTLQATRPTPLDEDRLPALTHLLEGGRSEAYVRDQARDRMPGPPWLARTPFYLVWILAQPALRSSRRRQLLFFEDLADDFETLEEEL